MKELRRPPDRVPALLSNIGCHIEKERHVRDPGSLVYALDPVAIYRRALVSERGVIPAIRHDGDPACECRRYDTLEMVDAVRRETMISSDCNQVRPAAPAK